MRLHVPALLACAAVLVPGVLAAQSLGDVARREAARKKAEAPASKQAEPPAAKQAPAASALSSGEATPSADQGAPSSSGQAVSLGQVAEKEAARRKAVAASGQHVKVLTTDDVKKAEPPATADTTPAADAASKADATGTATDKAEPAPGKPPADEPKGQEYWQGRMGSAREELRRNETFAEALQSRINALSADFAARDDPYQRAQIADDRQKAMAELDRLTKAIDDNRKQVAQIEEDARRAGIPAGWIS